ncbi:hypothetical protein CRG98_013145 [Punica granatum]|uniref:Uncharacterized protein n=1 Tax=Punica granatum TaxID=22663 RepID=A0A2I0KD78_PUNGR|nr:hypothetical protein CRG98_013145 [Punica granatum]
MNSEVAFLFLPVKRSKKKRGGKLWSLGKKESEPTAGIGDYKFETIPFAFSAADPSELSAPLPAASCRTTDTSTSISARDS